MYRMYVHSTSVHSTGGNIINVQCAYVRTPTTPTWCPPATTPGLRLPSRMAPPSCLWVGLAPLQRRKSFLPHPVGLSRAGRPLTHGPSSHTVQSPDPFPSAVQFTRDSSEQEEVFKRDTQTYVQYIQSSLYAHQQLSHSYMYLHTYDVHIMPHIHK